MTKNKLAIVGAGGHGKVVADCARLMGRWSNIIFFDDKLGADSSIDSLLKTPPDEMDVVIAIGANSLRQKFFLAARDQGFELADIRHPSSIVAKESRIGAGCVLVAGAIVNPGVEIGDGGIINTGASVDHDCQLGDFVHIAPGARLAGGVCVKDRSWIGLGAVVCENRTVGNDAMVAAGAVVIADITDRKTVMGVPAT